MRYREILRESAVLSVSPQQAKDARMFGPLYHGTHADLGEIIGQGFDSSRAETARSNGFSLQAYGTTGIAPPVHFLGNGTYMTTVKAIAKQFAGGTTKGQRSFYLDSHNIEKINFGAPNTMMKWWLANGYTMTSQATTKRDHQAWIEATRNLTKNLSSKFDAVHYLGKGIRKLLDGDQICIYDTSLIRVIDQSLATGLEIGSKVVHSQAPHQMYKGRNDVYIDDVKPEDYSKPMNGWKAYFRADTDRRFPIHFVPPPNMTGVIIDSRPNPRGGNYYDVKWKKGGTQYNYDEGELKSV